MFIRMQGWRGEEGREREKRERKIAATLRGCARKNQNSGFMTINQWSSQTHTTTHEEIPSIEKPKTDCRADGGSRKGKVGNQVGDFSDQVAEVVGIKVGCLEGDSERSGRL
jgi:hypothetical protein